MCNFEGNASNQKRHVKKVHENDDDLKLEKPVKDTEIVDNEKTCTCSRCGKLFKIPYLRKRHMIVHQPKWEKVEVKNRFPCEILQKND